MIFAVGWPGGEWQATLKLTLIILAIYVAALWLTLIFWSFRDIRQRSRDPIVQFASVLLVGIFFLPGHWLYLILRPRYTLTELYERSLEEEALLQELEDQKACPTCKRRVQDDFLVCPSCRTQIKEPCRSCAKPLSYAWVACPFCGLEKAPREAFGTRGPREGARPGRPPRSEPAARVEPANRTPRPTETVNRARPVREPGAPPRIPPLVADDDGPVIGDASPGSAAP